MAVATAAAPLCWGLWLSVRLPDLPEALVSLALLLVLPAYVLTGVASAGAAVVLACKRQWREALSCLLVHAAIATVLLVPAVRESVVFAADCLHFAALAMRYERTVAATPRADAPRFVWFLWKDMPGVLGPDTHVILVFDESDEWALPDPARSTSWEDRAARAFANTTGSWMAPSMPDEAHHLFSHWYVARITY